VSVAAEIIEHLLRAAERRLGIDHPLPTAQTIDQMLESSWLSKMSEERHERRAGRARKTARAFHGRGGERDARELSRGERSSDDN